MGGVEGESNAPLSVVYYYTLFINTKILSHRRCSKHLQGFSVLSQPVPNTHHPVLGHAFFRQGFELVHLLLARDAVDLVQRDIHRCSVIELVADVENQEERNRDVPSHEILGRERDERLEPTGDREQ